MNPDSMTAFGDLDADVAAAIEIAAASETSNKPRIGGMGIYMEFPNDAGTQTTQIIITPEGFTPKGEPCWASIVSRTVADWSPRKQWRINWVRPSADSATKTPMEIAADTAAQIEKHLTRQMSYGLSAIRNQPIVFEMTDVDFADIREWKAPASALRRIQKARVALTFPEKLVK
jgi:hypothetical protein